MTVTRDELVAMVRRLEWRGETLRFKAHGALYERCPVCAAVPCRHDYPKGCLCTELAMRGGKPPIGHHVACELGDLLARLDAETAPPPTEPPVDCNGQRRTPGKATRGCLLLEGHEGDCDFGEATP